MSHRKIALSVGFFILISSLFIIVSLAYVIEKKGVFESKTDYTLIAKNAQNIEVGMPILFSGFEIAQVKSLRLDKRGEVLVTISVPEHNTKWIRSGSVFTLEKPLIGKAKITLSSSPMSSYPMSPKSLMRMHIDDGINELITNIGPLTVELQGILKNLNTTTHSLSDTNGSFQTSLHHIEKFTATLAASENVLHALSGDKNSAKTLNEALNNLNQSVKDFNTLVNNTNSGISEIREDLIQPSQDNVQELNLILKDINNKLKTIDSTVKMVGQSDKDIVYLKEEMKVWLEEVNELSTRLNAIIGERPQEEIELP